MNLTLFYNKAKTNMETFLSVIDHAIRKYNSCRTPFILSFTIEQIEQSKLSASDKLELYILLLIPEKVRSYLSTGEYRSSVLDRVCDLMRYNEHFRIEKMNDFYQIVDIVIEHGYDITKYTHEFMNSRD